MVTSGKHVDAKTAHAAGLIDEIVPEGELRAAAVALAKKIVAEKRPLRKVRDLERQGRRCARQTGNLRELPQGQCAQVPRLSRARIQHPLHRGRGESAVRRRPQVRAQAVHGADDRRTQSAAQRYVFFAERQVWKIPDVPEDTPIIPIRKVGIIGAGTMGGGISMNFANVGDPRDDRRDEAGRARSRSLRHSQELRAQRQERPSHDGRRREAHVAPQRHAQAGGSRGLRSRHRSGVREHGCEEGGVRQARPHREAGRDPRDEHLGARHQRNRDGGEAAGIRHRPALLLAGERDAAARSRARCRGPRSR